MWMVVITVSAGLVLVSLVAVLAACRPRHHHTDTEAEEQRSVFIIIICYTDNNMSKPRSVAAGQEAEEVVSHGDREALQPAHSRGDKRLYRPTESRA